MWRRGTTALLVLLGASYLAFRAGAIHDGPNPHLVRGFAVIAGFAVLLGIAAVVGPTESSSPLRASHFPVRREPALTSPSAETLRLRVPLPRESGNVAPS